VFNITVYFLVYVDVFLLRCDKNREKGCKFKETYLNLLIAMVFFIPKGLSIKDVRTQRVSMRAFCGEKFFKSGRLNFSLQKT